MDERIHELWMEYHELCKEYKENKETCGERTTTHKSRLSGKGRGNDMGMISEQKCQKQTLKMNNWRFLA